MQAEIVRLRTEQDILRADFAQQLRAAVAEAMAAQAPPAPPPLPLDQAARRPRPAMPHPSKFTGIRKEYDTWRVQMVSKLETDGAAIGAPYAQFNYIFHHLADQAQNMAATWFQDKCRDLTVEQQGG